MLVVLFYHHLHPVNPAYPDSDNGHVFVSGAKAGKAFLKYLLVKGILFM